MNGRSAASTVATAVLVAFLLLALAGADAGASYTSVDVYIFHLDSCPHCRSARTFLADLAEEVPVVPLHEYEVSSDRVAQQLFADMVTARAGAGRRDHDHRGRPDLGRIRRQDRG